MVLHSSKPQPSLRIHSPESSTILDRSQTEEREVIVGHSAAQRLLVVSFTARRDSIRMVSARKATKRERRDYEEGIIP
jgi:uncharacterized DUF497 family protein